MAVRVPIGAVLFSALVICLLFTSGPTFAGSYADSAHGNNPGPDLLSNNGYGVLRSVFNGTYVRGNCAHCHEQHASIGGAEPAPAAGAASDYLLLANGFSGKTVNPYAQTDNACFQCHATTGSLQSGGITNNNYSTTFGGAASTVTSIMAAFNLASYHNLYDIKRYITGVSGSKSFSNFPANSNPCSGCHNVHLAKANKRFPGNPVYTALSKPSAHISLWGDDTPAERMTTYATAYQPPYYTGSTNLEPDGVGNTKSTQAAKTPNYNSFCTDCHNATNTIYSTNLLRNLRTIDWSTEKHGQGNADDYIDVDLPYTAGSGSLGYVLSCTDCHEPHGSAHAFLLRPSVNGGNLGGTVTVGSNNTLGYLCARCHQDSNQQIHHTLNDRPYQAAMCGSCHGAGTAPIPCTNCHFHGSWVNDPANALDKTPSYAPTTRITF